VMMLREAVRLAREEQRVVVFVEPIALYPMRDLSAPDDKGWMHLYPPIDARIALGEVGVHGTGQEIAILSYGNGYYLSRQAAAELEAEGIALRVIDMRWISPQPDAALLAATEGCASVLIVDECRSTGSQSEGLMALFSEAGRTHVSRLAAEDCFIATGPSYAATLPSKEGIIAAARALLDRAK